MGGLFSRPACLLAAFLAALPVQAQLTLDQILSRVAEEASVLEEKAPLALTQETLEQRTVMPPQRFHPRLGAAAKPQTRLQVREVVSEYSVGPLKNSPSHDLYEFRQVISVDGRPVQSEESARHALSLGLRSADDRIRKRMLEDFAKHGLVDVATDYGMILLAFTRRGQAQMQIGLKGESTVGTDPVVALDWRQTTAAGGELAFHGRVAARHPLQGILWVRKSDGLPVRIQTWADYLAPGQVIRDEATIDYVMSSHGFLAPVSVVHRHLVNQHLVTENLYHYAPFKLFSADADIKFTTIPDEAAPKK